VSAMNFQLGMVYEEGFQYLPLGSLQRSQAPVEGFLSLDIQERRETRDVKKNRV
jgi:hypothetical protein